jgi:hypothetical protein
MSLAIIAGGARPVASDPELPMVAQGSRLLRGDHPSRRQPPSRFRPGFTYAASHGRSLRCAPPPLTDQRDRTQLHKIRLQATDRARGITAANRALICWQCRSRQISNQDYRENQTLRRSFDDDRSRWVHGFHWPTFGRRIPMRSSGHHRQPMHVFPSSSPRRQGSAQNVQDDGPARSIWRDGFPYAKGGVVLVDLYRPQEAAGDGYIRNSRPQRSVAAIAPSGQGRLSTSISAS